MSEAVLGDVALSGGLREFDWLYYRFLSADRKQLRISTHRASRLNLKCNIKTILFYALRDIFLKFLFMQ